MKAWMAVAMLAVVPLVGCGGSRELNRAKVEVNVLRKDKETLSAENEALKTKVGELEGELANVSKERDELKVAAEQAAAAAPAAVPASGKKRKK
ncbi:hypothetical protein HUA74_22305 [Myxococcus sp. CA051A]|uniref:Uncharacterized protein n=1 Tax=Myxococcus llanfairpwllgwyngyllgogerychwyrndrobwllllantysiliogogogochensis TaxID=2590453 RepID=A0A540X559_9BACT|nr:MULTISPECIES: hypothetical protein [Myxococcus]NTX05993.1 hypothetical protein [Myxococcus sp. CA040A]NTX10606.1 hypothetical protein [Myxococcus sp. CA056]NTX38240.1 hypothetical protein [Myxococcus sp. CA033]NTX55135.1 hypothetical protein [Myxococcus sp. CA039A]NTX63389.1 hypothetical protein [Myxococcus sp. CA051A]